jgi:hypothetical protein
MASDSNDDMDLEELIKEWSLNSPGYELGVELPIEVSTVPEESGPFDSLADFMARFSPEEAEYSRGLLSDVVLRLTDFTALCKSKIKPDEWKLLDEKLPEAIAELIKGLMDKRKTVGPRKYCDYPSVPKKKDLGLNPETDIVDINSVSAPSFSFLEKSMHEKISSIPDPRLHQCNLQFCPVKGRASGITSPNFSGTCFAEFCNPSDPEMEDLSRESLLEEIYYSRGAKPKILNPRKKRRPRRE